jgi:hypothetical protein
MVKTFNAGIPASEATTESEGSVFGEKMETPVLRETLDMQGIVRHGIDQAIDFIDSEISTIRQTAEAYYRGGTQLKHEPGRSGVVVTKVRDTIQGIIPSVARVFTQSDKTVEFNSDDEEDERITIEETQFCQNIYDRHGGYAALIGATIDSMKARVGFVTVDLIKSHDVSAGQEQRLVAEDIERLDKDPRSIITNIQETDETIDGLPVFKAMTGRIIPRNKWNLKVRAPESFIIERNATSLDDARLFGFREIKRRYEAVEMGISKEDAMSVGGQTDSGTMLAERDVRLGFSSQVGDDEDAADPMSVEILVCEIFMRIDSDGDGIAEFWKFITIGDNHKIIQANQVNYHNVACFKSNLEPNTFFPKSMAEDLIQDQDAMTGLTRSILDNTALVNSPRTVINENQVNLEDAKNSEIGSMIRAKQMGQIEELVTPFVAGQTLPVLQYLEKVSESRSGLTKWAQGIDPDALQSTTKQASMASIQAGDARVEMIARNIAETGVAEMFFAILRTAIYELDTPQSIKINESYEEVDPRLWHDELTVSCNVGLGNGNIEGKSMVLDKIAQMQQMLITQFGLTNPISGYTQMRNTIKHQLYLSGIRNINEYFPMVPPEVLQHIDQQMQQQKQNQSGDQAAMAQVQAWAQVEREKAQMKMQADQQKLQQEFMLEMKKMQQEARNEMAKLITQLRTDTEKTRLEDDRTRDKNAQDYAVSAYKVQLDDQTKKEVAIEVNKDRGYENERNGRSAVPPPQNTE